jgi:hypothetical protein
LNISSATRREPEPSSRSRKVSWRSFVQVEAAGVAQRVVGRADQHVGVAGHRLGVGVDLDRDAAHHGEVDGVVLELLQQALAVADRELNLDAGMRLRELGEQAGHEVFGGADQADRQLAGLGTEQALQVGLGVLDFAEHAQRVVHQQITGIGQRDAAPQAFEQRQADVVLELLELHRDGRRRQVQLLGGAGVAEVAGGDDEDLQLAERQGADEVHGWFLFWLWVVRISLMPGFGFLVPFLKPGFPRLRRGLLSSCVAKKKVSKEEGDPGSAPGCAGSLRYSAGGGCGTRPCGPQTVLALLPPTSALLGASQGARKNIRAQPTNFDFGHFFGSTVAFQFSSCCPSPDAFRVPLRGAEQRSGWRKKGEDCLRAEGPSSAAPASGE